MNIFSSMKSVLVMSILCSALVGRCEQLSTVFVLETSDNINQSETSVGAGGSHGPPAPSNNSKRESKALEEPSTRIITDNHEHHQHQASGSGQASGKQEPAAKSQQQSPRPSSQKSSEQTLGAGKSGSQAQQHQHPAGKPKPSSGEGYSASPAPKAEERLLISITSSEEEDDGYPAHKPPRELSGGGSSLYEAPSLSSAGSGSSGVSLPSGGSSSSEQHSPKRKQHSILISIQEPGMKQSGQSGSVPTVVLRPSENGIVISTVGHSAGSGGSPTLLSAGHQAHKQPQKLAEAAGELAASQHSSTTHRPPLLGPVNEPPSSRPILSLLESVLKPSSLSEERPQRPAPGALSRPQEANPNELEPPAEAHLGQPKQPKFPLNENQCGVLHDTKIVGGDEANPDDYLWMAAIIKSRPSGDAEARPFCGGSLITRRHILTAAHCLENLAPRDVLVRLGSYDFEDATASSTSADYAIDQFRVPAQYSKKTHVADIAIMRLKTPIAPTDNYKTVCMPQPRRSYVGALGTVTGYGSQSETFRKATPKLRQVTVPILENRKCSLLYKRNMTDSFLCAGYDEGGKDACQGDSGGPLMTEGSNGGMMVVGVVSHGIGCGAPGYPGVYTRTTTFLDWIEKNTKE